MQNETGFTLIEILIALFIFTILSFIMASGLRSVTNTQSNLENHRERLAELQMAMLLVAKDIEQSINRPITNTNGLEAAFVGAPNQINFTHGGYSNPLGELPRSTLQRTQYVLYKNNLIRNNAPVLDHTAKLAMQSRIILRNVIRVEFKFLDAQKHFLPSWPPPDKTQTLLPSAVKMTLTLKDLGKISQLYVIAVDPPEQTIGPPSDKPQ